MEYIILTITVKALIFLAGLIGTAVWYNAGCPFYTITRR